MQAFRAYCGAKAPNDVPIVITLSRKIICCMTMPERHRLFGWRRTSKSRIGFAPVILITGAGDVLKLEVAYAKEQADAWNDVSDPISECKPGNSGIHVSLPVLHEKSNCQVKRLPGRL